MTQSDSIFPEKINLKRIPTSPRTLFSSAMTVVAFACGSLALIPLVLVLGFVIFKGGGNLGLSVFTEPPPSALSKDLGGFGHAIVGTLIMVSISSLISIPIGVFAAIYLNEFSTGDVDAPIARWVRFANNVLSGTPSIMAGVFAYAVVVLTIGRPSAFAGGVALAVLMLPTIVRATEEALILVPRELREASVGLGGTKFQTVWWVVIPAALPTIVTGVTLAIARAAGETAPLIFTALNSNFWPKFDNPGELLFTTPTASLSVLVYKYSTGFAKNQQDLAWTASLVLVFLVLITSIVARVATNKKKY